MNTKRIFAILAVALLAIMYLITLILAFCDFDGSRQLLIGFILLDVTVPLFLWILIYIHKHFSSKD